MDRVRVAVAQLASVFADKSACIDKAVGVIKEAGENGADLVLLPEVMIPGYPRGFTYGAYVGNRTGAGRADFARYWLLVGSLMVLDDEGIPTERTQLIDNGQLVNFLADRLGAEKTGHRRTGSGRRQSYRFAPASRMRKHQSISSQYMK